MLSLELSELRSIRVLGAPAQALTPFSSAGHMSSTTCGRLGGRGRWRFGARVALWDTTKRGAGRGLRRVF